MKQPAIAGLIALMACQAQADTASSDLSPWTMRAGAGVVRFHSATYAEVPRGSALPGAQVGVDNNTGVGVDVVYQIAPDWQSHVSFGVPPTTTLHAHGTLAAFVQPNGPLTGVLGKVKYAPLIWSVTYSPGNYGGIEPYVGAGINYTWALESRDADVAGLSVKNAWGSALHAGLNIPLASHWSLFLDVRKVYVKTTATGTVPAMGGLPVGLALTLNPVLVFAGVSYRF